MIYTGLFLIYVHHPDFLIIMNATSKAVALFNAFIFPAPQKAGLLAGPLAIESFPNLQMIYPMASKEVRFVQDSKSPVYRQLSN